MDTKLFKKNLFENAKKEGFSEYELYYSKEKKLSVSVFKGELEKYSNSESSGISFRGIFEGKMGYAFCEKIDNETIPFLLKYAKENAQIISENEKEEIFEGSKEYKNIKTYHEDLENLQVDEMIEYCLRMEKAVLRYDKRIKSCNFSKMSKTLGEIYIANSKGLELNQKSNFILAYVGALAEENNKTKSGGEIFVGFGIKEFNPEKISETASKNAIQNLNAQSIKSGEYNIVFENECFTNLFSSFISNFVAENVQKGFSLLKNKINEKIASPLITILDEPLMENGYASSSFDSEGVACENKCIVENGILKTYLYNLKTAKKDGVKSAGNGFRGSFKGNVSTSPTNFYIKNGEETFEDIIKYVKNGILIKNVSGLHSGISVISGDFSLLAEGFLIEEGKITKPLEQITVSGNYFSMIKNIEKLGNDLKFSPSGIGTPSAFVGKLNIAGE